MMGIFDSLIYGTKQPSPIGTLTSLATMPFSTPGFGSGMGADNMVAPSTAAPPGPVSSDDSNSGPSTWQRIAGIVGDALLTGTGHQTVYGPAAQAYAKMQMDPTDKAYKQAQIYALQHPQQKPNEFQQTLIGANYLPGSPDFIRLSQQKAQNEALGVPVAVDSVDPTTHQTIRTYQQPGALLAMAGGAVPGVQTGPTPDAIDYLTKNPAMAPQFDQKYGAGASTRYLSGGAAPTAPSPFPIR